MRFSRKRLLMAAGGVTALAAVGSLAVGITFGLFSANLAQSPANTFTAGTVTLTQVATHSCSVGPMEAGDQSAGYTPTNPNLTGTAGTACSFEVNYSGTLGAFIGLGLATTGNLYDGTANGLQFQVSDATGTKYYTGGGIINANTPGDPLYVSRDPANTTTGTNHTFTVQYSLPQGAGNTYQGLTSTLTITVFAVQDSNNGAGTCTPGVQCSQTGTGVRAWS